MIALLAATAQTDNPAAGITLLVVLGLICVGYMMPWCIAVMRGHRSSMAIGALNLLLGWTLLGWVAAFVWSLTDTR